MGRTWGWEHLLPAPDTALGVRPKSQEAYNALPGLYLQCSSLCQSLLTLELAARRRDLSGDRPGEGERCVHGAALTVPGGRSV